MRIGKWLSSNRGVVVFLGAFVFSLPGSLQLIRRSIELAPLSHEERRERALGPPYVTLRALEKELPDGDVSVLLLGPNAIDRGVFVNYYLYPRAAHLHFDSLPAETRRPLLVTEAEGPVRRTIVKDLAPTSGAHRDLIVPIVSALQGGDGYATEAIITAAHDTQVALTLMPSGATRNFTIRAGTPLIFADLVRECFGLTATGWLRIRAQKPVRAGIWFVNHVRAVAAPIPVVTQIPPIPQSVAGGEKLWILNPGEAAATVLVHGHRQVIEGGELRVFSAEEINDVDADRPLIAFTSLKTADGNTRFVWPRGIE
jgi:hypothetical protein